MTRVIHARRSQFKRGQLDFIKDPKARAQGAKARKSGKSFEDAIEASCEWYRANGQAVITRNYPPTAGYGRSLRYTGKGVVDFTGWTPPSGDLPEYAVQMYAKPIAFDCKCITGSASYKHAERDRHQLEFLLDWSRAGVSGLLLHDSDMGCTWWLSGGERLRTLLAGGSVPIRTKQRNGEVVHHLPVLTEADSLWSTLKESGKIGVRWPFLEIVEQVTASSEGAA